ncbi:MAG: thioredoxin family protein [Alphaproteobacteria bacterium]|nr:thioredoxin family protein [Alphaproteobacteria bacterium]
MQLIKKFLLNRLLYKLIFFVCLLFSTEIEALFNESSVTSDALLISSVTGVGNQNVIWVGLDLHLQPGWKTYWRTPGSAGYGLKVDWTASQNLASADILWPVPSKITSFNMIANGYKNHVLFPIKITLKETNTPLTLKANLDYLMCDEANCIPQTKQVSITIPKEPSIPTSHAKEISLALQHVPEKENPLFEIKSLYYMPSSVPPSYLRLTLTHQNPLSSPEIFIEENNHLYVDNIRSIETISKNGAFVSTIDIPLYKNEKKEDVHVKNLIGEKIMVTLRSGETSVEQTLITKAVPSNMTTTISILGFSLLGGFILNFMPCVLPVILIKIFSLTQYGGRTSSAVRRALFATISGILSSFLLLSLIPIFLNWVGMPFGWGMQFQQPLFVIFMMLVLTLFAVNFWGLYEINLPLRLAEWSYKYSDKEGQVGHFLSGMVATLLATPCSAPFLGTAVAFALSRGPIEILLVFFFLGLGLSLPMITVLIFPKLVTLLPKPGKWMMHFKHLLGWGFFLTLIWLFYVLMQQVSLLFALFILFVMILLIGMFFISNKIQGHKYIYLTSIFIISILPFSILAIDSFPPQQDVSYEKRPLDKLKAIQTAVEQGKTVFVDVTADWCLTCKANELLVLDTLEMKNFMKENEVLFIKIDWTSKNSAVYDYLRSFDHNGIPFYAIYGPHTPYGQALPQLLTYQIVHDAIVKEKKDYEKIYTSLPLHGMCLQHTFLCT